METDGLVHNQLLHLREHAIVVDGTKEVSHYLERVLTNDPGIGVARHADAGYDLARQLAKEKGVKIPMMASWRACGDAFRRLM